MTRRKNPTHGNVTWRVRHERRAVRAFWAGVLVGALIIAATA